MLATAEMETEVDDFIAVNCSPRAIATHTANHASVRHYCRRLESLRVEDVVKGARLHVLLASPECTHHSSARGGKPMNDQSRSGAWHILDWASKLYIDIILIENVKEFRSWGPLGTDGRPLKKRKGETYQAFLASLRALGYSVEDRLLNAADFGDATSRTRLFIQARRAGKIRWPQPTHFAAGDGILCARHRPAREIIDWSLGGESIFERKRPLSDKTMRRIWAGLNKFGLKAFMVPGFGERPQQDPRTHGVDLPAPTIAANGHTHLVQPFILPKVGVRGNNQPRSVETPLNTVITDGRVHLVQPFILPTQTGEGRVRDIERPLQTVATESRGIGLARPFLVKLRGTNDGADVDKPSPTVAAGGNHIGLAQPFLVECCHAGERSAKSVDAPVPTITCAQRGELALCEPALLPQQSGGSLRLVSEPAPTIAARGAIGFVEPFLVEYYGTGETAATDKPLGTVTTKPRFGLVRPTVVIDGERYLLDIRFRMLQPHELAAAQGFPKDYVFTGNKTEQVRQIGNAVPVNLARALVRAALEGIAA